MGFYFVEARITVPERGRSMPNWPRRSSPKNQAAKPGEKPGSAGRWRKDDLSRLFCGVKSHDDFFVVPACAGKPRFLPRMDKGKSPVRSEGYSWRSRMAFW